MRIHLPISLKLSIFIIVLLFIGLAIMTAIFTVNMRIEIREKFGLTLEHIATTSALFIDEKEHRQIHTMEDVNTKEFVKIKAILKKVQIANNLELDTIYTFQVKADGNPTFGVMLFDPPFSGNTYIVPPVNQWAFDKVIKEGKSVHTGLYKDAHGTWISGLAPIINARGKVTGVLEVDFKVAKFLNELYLKLVNELLPLFGGLILGGSIISFFASQDFTRPIKILQDSSQKMIQGDYSNINLKKIKNHDEIGDLARNFARMINVVQERVHLLKYIPKGTLDMVQRLINNEISEKGEKKELAILFSDIRGFTSFSESRTPQEVVNMLNEYLEAQTDVIKQFKGSIDKFVGDEIIAYFDGPSKSLKAVECACTMQEVIAKLQKSSKTNAKLDIGIGIAKGEVVMGSIGGKDLKDYTAIGSYMNLAARMCSGAAPKITIVSKEIQEDITSQNLVKDLYVFKFEKEEQYKGFSQPITTFSVTKAVDTEQDDSHSNNIVT